MLTSNLEGNRARSRCKDLSRLRTGETLITYYETSCEEGRGKEMAARNEEEIVS